MTHQLGIAVLLTLGLLACGPAQSPAVTSATIMEAPTATPIPVYYDGAGNTVVPTWIPTKTPVPESACIQMLKEHFTEREWRRLSRSLKVTFNQYIGPYACEIASDPTDLPIVLHEIDHLRLQNRISNVERVIGTRGNADGLEQRIYKLEQKLSGIR